MFLFCKSGDGAARIAVHPITYQKETVGLPLHGTLWPTAKPFVVEEDTGAAGAASWGRADRALRRLERAGRRRRGGAVLVMVSVPVEGTRSECGFSMTHREF